MGRSDGGISFHFYISGERGLKKLGICGIDISGADAEETEESESELHSSDDLAEDALQCEDSSFELLLLVCEEVVLGMRRLRWQ